MDWDVCLASQIAQNERLHRDAVAFVEGDRTLTHGQFAARARQLGSAVHRCGGRHQDRIAILSQNRLEYAEVYGAAELCGFIVATINFRLAPAEIHAIVLDSTPQVLFFEQRHAEALQALPRGREFDTTFVCLDGELPWAVSYEAFVASGANVDVAGPPQQAGGDDLAALIYTSGSTGRPKGCMLGQRELARIGATVALSMALTEHDRMVLPMPLFHVGAKLLQLAAHTVGARVQIVRDFEPAAFLALLQDSRATVTLLAPTMIQMLMEVPGAASFDLSALRMVMYSASAMPLPTVRRAIAMFGNVFQNGYGMTEGPVSVLQPHLHQPDGDARAQERLRSVGVPYPHVAVKVVRDDGSDAGLDEVGELCMRSEMMYRGYWNDPAATIAARRGGWHRTGDLGRIDADGFIYLVDRKKDMIITGGENVYSREVEDALLAHPAVLEAAVIGVPDARWGEAVCAVIVLREGAVATEAQIVAHCRERIASYKKPARVLFVPELPKFPSGKINKPRLRARHAATAPTADLPELPEPRGGPA